MVPCVMKPRLEAIRWPGWRTLSLCVSILHPCDGVPAPHRVRNRDGRWLGGVWVDGPSCCAKILTTHGNRALDLTTLLDSYSQAIDASWPLFWVWALPSRPVCEVRHPATDAKYNPRRRTLYATRTCFGIFLPHSMCVEARGSAVEGG